MSCSHASLNRDQQEGFSLIEILLVLAIIALLSVAAFIIFAQVREASDANTETAALTTVIASVRNLYANRSDYAGLTTGVVNQARIFPRTMNNGIYTTSQPINHIGGGLVEVAPWDADLRRFAIIYRNTPSSLCVRLAQNYGANVDEVMVGSVHVKNFGDRGSNPVDSVRECNVAPFADITFIQK